MNGALLHHDLRIQWRSIGSIAFQSAISLILLLLIGQLWSGNSFSSADIDLRGRGLFQMLGVVVTVMTMLWVPVAGMRLLADGCMNSALWLALQTPATIGSIVRERFTAWLMHAMMPAMISMPFSMACYTVGSVDLQQVLLLYVVIGVLTAQLVAVGLFFACRATSTYSALRAIYSFVLVLMLLAIVPEVLTSIGVAISTITYAGYLTLFSPAAAVAQAIGGDTRQLVEQSALIYILLTVALTVVCLFLTINHLDTDTLLATGRHNRRRFWIMPHARKYLGLSDRWSIRNKLAGQYRTGFNVLLLAAIVVGIAGSRHPSAQTNAALAALVVTVSMIIAVLVAPGLSAAIITEPRWRGTWQAAEMAQLTSVELVIPKIFRCFLVLIVLLIALMPASLMVSYLDLTGTWSSVKFMGILAMFVLVVVSWSAMVGSFLNRTGQSYAIAYLTVLVFCVLVPLVALSGAAAGIIDIYMLNNFCPPLLVVDVLALDHEPKVHMSANIILYFTTIILVCLIITITRVWWLRQSK